MREMSEQPPQTAYLFQCRNDAALFAVSLNEEARNIPPSTAWYGGWHLRKAFPLDADEPILGEGAAKRVLNGVRSVGYHVWRDGSLLGWTAARP
jgi:hypothetical protein